MKYVFNPLMLMIALTAFIVFGCSNKTTKPLTELSKPTFSHLSGIYNSEISVSIVAEDSGVKIYYTTDATSPSTNSLLYVEPIRILQTTVIKAYAVKDGYAPSQVNTASYTFNACLPPVPNYPSGVYQDSLHIRFTCPTPGATTRYRYDGEQPNDVSSSYDPIYPLRIGHSTTVRSVAYKQGLNPSTIGEVQYQIGSYQVPVIKSYPEIDAAGLQFLNDNYAYYYLSNDGIKILNTSDPVNVSEIGTIPDSGGGISYDCLAIKSNFLYFNRVGDFKNERSTAELVVYDVTNPTSPIQIGSTMIPVTFPIEFSMIRVFGQNMVMLLGSKVVILDLTNPQSPKQIAEINTGSNMLFVDCQVSGNNLYLIDYYLNSFEIYNIANLSYCQLLSSYTIERPYQLQIHESCAYIAGNDGLCAVDVSNPSSPSIKQNYGANFCRQMGISNDLLIVHGGYGHTKGILVYDISNPQIKRIEASFYYSPYTWGYGDIVVRGNYAFIPYGQELAVAYIGYIQ
jgi:hypothetical protein